MAYSIDIGGFSWTPKRPIGQERTFKADPSAWQYQRETVKVDYADLAVLRDRGASVRTITVSGITASDDRNEMLGEIDAFTSLRGNADDGRECTITADGETYEGCVLMDAGNPTVEPSADPLYHIAFELTFLQFADGETPALAAAGE